jgi:hypothetical protein
MSETGPKTQLKGPVPAALECLYRCTENTGTKLKWLGGFEDESEADAHALAGAQRQ